MQIVWDIAIHTVEILTLLFGILGMAFSLLLLISPRLTRTIGKFFNRNISVESKINILDKNIQTETIIYSHHIIFGLCLFAGSIFVLIFFFFNLEVTNFTRVFVVSQKYFFILEVVINTFVWIAKIACIFGLVSGAVLLFAPNKMRKVERQVNTWFETRDFFKKLDQMGPELDALFFRHPFFFGLTGALISFLIITLSMINLLG